MTETITGFKRAKASAKVVTSKNEKYDSLATKAARNCGVTINKGQTLCLFKMNGVKIADNVDKKPWTLGAYVKLTKRSLSKLTIGVGCITNKKGAVQPKVNDMHKHLQINMHMNYTYMYKSKTSLWLYRMTTKFGGKLNLAISAVCTKPPS